MPKLLLKIGLPILLLLFIYLLGPAPQTPKFDSVMPSVPADPNQLEAYIQQQEQKHILKPNNEARVVWFDSTRSKTKFSVVYLHGFSASQEEGDPIHTDFAKKFGCNLYLARLADHGIDTTEQLLYFTADRLWESSKEALAIGKAIGENVILMSTSTGGTMALMLAADYPQDVAALINMSPNIAINSSTAFLLNNHWGLQIARQVIGGKYLTSDLSPEREQYWNGNYRVEALTQLEELLETKMNKSTFEKVTQPSLTLYYYKDEQHQDPTVSVPAMLEMNKELSTPDSLKVMVPVPEAGAHVIGSSMVSKDLKTVREAIDKFAMEKLHMIPLN